jgi:hypothetical protein
MLENNEGEFSGGVKAPGNIDNLKKQIYHYLMVFQGRDPLIVG